MPTVHTPATTSRAPRLLLLGAGVLALALLAIALLAPARAPARGTTAHRSNCVSAGRHAKHPVKARRCTKRASRRPRPAARPHGHPLKKGSRTGSTAPAASPALCEDASAPVRSSGGFLCQDGSEPGCEAGGEPLTSAAGVPECRAPATASTGALGEACAGEGECQSAELTCEESVASGEASPACEAPGGGEAAS